MIKGYYTNNVYMGFIPSVGKYWQFESENALTIEQMCQILDDFIMEI